MLEDLVLLINEMHADADPEIKAGWKQVEPLISTSGIITLTWPKWRLKIISFKMPEKTESSKALLDHLKTIDELYVTKDETMKQEFLWRTPQTEHLHDWSKYEKPYVVDVVDMFLKGEWTPPWKCSVCISRHKSSVAPKF